MSEEEKGRMDRKSNSRQCSPLQKNGADIKKDNTSRNQRWGKRGGGASSGNFNYNDGQGKKPTPQKYKNTWDKRPRTRGEFPETSRGDLEENVAAEYGSAIPTGSRKGNLNHLLNFTYNSEDDDSYRHRVGVGSSGRGWGRGRQVRYRNNNYRGSKVFYNKERFLQANCQFVVKEAGDYSVHHLDPDSLVDWGSIEQVRVIDLEPPSCPICLQPPTAAKMTRCGHIYCWACILHYLALGEKNWRKCPICYESIQSDDLKSVISRQVKNYKVGDTITMTLMRKEKGSIYAVPAYLWQKTEKNYHNVQENEEVTRHMKLLTARPEQVLQQLEMEKEALMVQMACAENSEEPFIKGAQEQLKAKQDLMKGKATPKKDKPVKVTPEPVAPTVQLGSGNKKIKTYKSAFSDDEEEKEDDSPAEETVISEMTNTSVSESDVSSAEMSVNAENSSIPHVLDASAGSDLGVVETESAEFVPVPPESLPPVEMMPDSMPLEEAAEQLELPTQGASSSKSRNKSGDHSFYFYQSEDGQHIYLHSLNARCLVKEYGSLENSPQKVTAVIVEKESVFVSEELRKRLRYLSHLPLTCGFEVAELSMKPPLISKETVKSFTDEIEKRRRMRQRRNRDEKRMARRIEEEERKQFGLSNCTIIPSQFTRPSASKGEDRRLSETRSDTSSPSLDTPIGSPQGMNIHASEFHPTTSTSHTLTDDGSQDSVVSFAQMLKAGTQAPVWPKKKSETMPSIASHPRVSDESDNEDKVPVPEYQSSFGSAIEAALVNIGNRTEDAETSKPSGNKSSGKKKKKQLVLFSTSMARGGK